MLSICDRCGIKEIATASVEIETTSEPWRGGDVTGEFNGNLCPKCLEALRAWCRNETFAPANCKDSATATEYGIAIRIHYDKNVSGDHVFKNALVRLTPDGLVPIRVVEDAAVVLSQQAIQAWIVATKDQLPESMRSQCLCRIIESMLRTGKTETVDANSSEK